MKPSLQKRKRNQMIGHLVNESKKNRDPSCPSNIFIFLFLINTEENDWWIMGWKQ